MPAGDPQNKRTFQPGSHTRLPCMQPASPGTIGGPPGLRGVVRAVNKTTAVPGPKYWGKPAHMLTTAAYRREHGNIQRRTIPVQHPVHSDRAEAPERCVRCQHGPVEPSVLCALWAGQRIPSAALATAVAAAASTVMCPGQQAVHKAAGGTREMQANTLPWTCQHYLLSAQ